MKVKSLRHIVCPDHSSFEKSAQLLCDEHLLQVRELSTRTLYDIYERSGGIKVPSGTFDTRPSRKTSRLWKSGSVWLARYLMRLMFESHSRTGHKFAKHMVWVKQIADDESSYFPPEFVTKEWALECRRYLYSLAPEVYYRRNQWSYRVSPSTKLVSPEPPKAVRLASSLDELLAIGWSVKVVYSKESYYASLELDSEQHRVCVGPPASSTIQAARAVFRKLIRETSL